MALDNKFRILFILFINCTFIFAQEKQYSTTSKKAIKNFEEAITSFDMRMDIEAEKYLKKAIDIDSNFIEAYTVLADMYSNNKRPKEAIKYYKKALEKNANFFPNNYNSLGEEQLKLGLYADAKESFSSFLKTNIKNPNLKRKAQRNLGNAEFAVYATKHPVPFNPENLGKAVNTKYMEYLPTLTADGQMLIVTVCKPDDTTRTDNDNMKGQHEDFYSSKNINGVWQKRTNVGAPINTVGNEGAQCISPDGQILFFTSCEEGPGQYAGGRKGYGSCDIFFSQKVGDTWGKPQNIGQPINSNDWDTQPSISSDGNTLYFVSSRKGGKGGGDLWMSTLNKQGYWGIPQNLGDSINTEFEEGSPFIHPDNQTLYFCSMGHTGMGGSDLFLSRKNKDGKFGKPINLGYPINTAGKESSLIVSTDGKKAYYSSLREGGFGLDDIYSFDLPQALRPQATSYFKGRVFDKLTGKGLEARFELVDLLTGQTITESYSNSSNGDFLVCLPTNKNYLMNISKNGYLFYSENFELTGANTNVTNPFVMDVPLTPIKAGEKVVLKNVFFNTGSFELKDESKNELQKLVSFLNKNATIKIEIAGHTDNVGAKDKNQILSENRAKAVVDFLIANKIDATRLKYRGYGDTQPLVDNSTEQNKATNRRTEFKIVE